MSSAPESISYERDGALGRIRLNRPEALNAWTPDMGRELLAAVRRAADDESVRAVLITGAGRAFSSGADLKVPRELTGDGAPDLTSRLREIYNPIVVAVREAPKPVVAAVNGPAAGLGFSLALACDLIVAAESAYFLLPFINLGLTPDAGAFYHLAARVGTGRALQLAMLAERLPAPRALDWGLVNAVYPDDEFRASAEELGARLAAGPTVAYSNLKRLAASTQDALAAQLKLEATLQQKHATTNDYAEGVAAFKERRKPDFQGG